MLRFELLGPLHLGRKLNPLFHLSWLTYLAGKQYETIYQTENSEHQKKSSYPNRAPQQLSPNPLSINRKSLDPSRDSPQP